MVDGVLAPGKCHLGDNCRHPVLPFRARYKCRKCNNLLHAQCGKRVLDDSNGDYEGKYAAHTSTGSAPVLVDETQSEIERQCKSELLNYRGTHSIPTFVGTNMNDPLLWWKQHAGAFPTLWLLAAYFLAIPGTSALSERCFSAAGRIFTPSRAGVMSTDSFVESYVIKRNMDLLPSTPQKNQKK